MTLFIKYKFKAGDLVKYSDKSHMHYIRGIGIIIKTNNIVQLDNPFNDINLCYDVYCQIWSWLGLCIRY